VTDRPHLNRPELAANDPAGGRMADNIMHFARVLRRAGLPVGPGTVLEALRAVEAVGFEHRMDFYWAMHAVFVNRRDQRPIFDQAFHVFWKNPNLLERVMALMLPSFQAPGGPDQDQAELSRLVAEALQREAEPEGSGGEEPGEQEIEIDMALTFSKEEVLRAKDFEDMSGEELDQARQMIRKLRLPIMELPTRRFAAHPSGPRADMRATLRASARQGADMIFLKRKKRRTRHPPLVVICDISGSMDRYARMLLHFLHAITNDRDRVFTFLFGTRLTNVTRYLRARDPDIALDSIAEAVEDWAGGTRIGGCLEDFNRFWGRRVLTQGAVVLLITDGLDREGAQGLSVQMERLQKSCRRMIWLNPLLRYDAFEPKAQGARAIMPFVDEFRPVHNLESLQQLADVLGEPNLDHELEMRQWRERAA